MIPINLFTLEKTLELPPALAGGKYYYTRILCLKPISYIIYPPSEDGGYSLEHTFVRLGMFDSYQSIYIRDALELPPASAGGKHQCAIGFSQKFGVDAR